MSWFQGFIAFIGRFFLSLFFISSGMHQIFDWQGTEQAVISILNDWSAMTIGDETWRNFFTAALSWSSILVSTAIFFQLIGGLCILLGIQVRFGAFLLILILTPATFLRHHFWTMIDPEKGMQMALFMKNLGVVGGLFILLAYGKGKRKKEVKPPVAEKT